MTDPLQVSPIARTRQNGAEPPVYVEKGWIFMAPGYADRFEPTHWLPLPTGPQG